MRKEGSVIPSNWQPSAEEIQYGLDLGWTWLDIKDMADDMRIWALSNAHREIARKADWHQTFLGWMRREAKKARLTRPHEKSYAELADELRRSK
jgi:hypothetical protein